MKKALSIFLFVCFAIYHFGYYAFYFSYNQHLESKWEDIIYGENSVEGHEVVLEIPLSAPYMANQEQFQPTNTSFERMVNISVLSSSATKMIRYRSSWFQTPVEKY